MKKWQNILTQVVMTGGQALNIWQGFIPDKYKMIIALGLGSVQLVAANMAHNSNPDGTPVELPYVEPTKK